MLKILFIGAGGFIGAVARYGVSVFVQRRAGATFPAGTLAVNLIGCFLLGALMCLVEDREAFSPNTRAFLAIGLLGAFTTFSTFSYETLGLFRDGSPGLALLNVFGSVAAGLVAVWLGWGAARALAA